MTGDSRGSTATILRDFFRGFKYCTVNEQKKHNQPLFSLQTFNDGLNNRLRRTWADPVKVPPVPTPPTKMSMLPEVWYHSSGPVVSLFCHNKTHKINARTEKKKHRTIYLCVFGLFGLLNCCSMYPPGVLATSASAFAMAPFIPAENWTKWWRDGQQQKNIWT